jgi:putative phosphoribosyl transferase
MKPSDRSIFASRSAAGRALAGVLARKHLTDPVVLALPRGGVPVAAEIARRLGAPLDLVLVRKIGVPYQRELAAAAVVDGGDAEIVTNDDVMAMTGLTRADIGRLAKRELAEIERRRQAYLQARDRVPLEGRTLIVVDDGIATGATVRAALIALRRRHPRALILAVPVAPADTVAALRAEVDDVVCLEMPDPFIAIGLHYRDFHQLSDADVVAALAPADTGPSDDSSGATAA